jgi:hypothetical protein
MKSIENSTLRSEKSKTLLQAYTKLGLRFRLREVPKNILQLMYNSKFTRTNFKTVLLSTYSISPTKTQAPKKPTGHLCQDQKLPAAKKFKNCKYLLDFSLMEIKFQKPEKQIWGGQVLKPKFVKCSKFMFSLCLVPFKYKLLFKMVFELLKLICLTLRFQGNMYVH